MALSIVFLLGADWRISFVLKWCEWYKIIMLCYNEDTMKQNKTSELFWKL